MSCREAGDGQAASSITASRSRRRQCGTTDHWTAGRSRVGGAAVRRRSSDESDPSSCRDSVAARLRQKSETSWRCTGIPWWDRAGSATRLWLDEVGEIARRVASDQLDHWRVARRVRSGSVREETVEASVTRDVRRVRCVWRPTTCLPDTHLSRRRWQSSSLQQHSRPSNLQSTHCRSITISQSIKPTQAHHS